MWMIQSPATRACLMKTGFNRNTAHRVVFGPSIHGSLGFRDLFVEQGISQVQLLIRHLRADSPQGRLFRITIDWWQLVMGVSYPLLERPSTTLPHQDAHWLSALRQFLLDLNASIHIASLATKLLPPLRENDTNLMDAVLELPTISRPHLLAFNRCRIFFDVTYLAEISTADGTTISRDAWDGARVRYSPLLWPYQPEPGPKSFRVWRRLLATAYLQGHQPKVSIKNRDLTLQQKLRRWLPASTAFQYQWPSIRPPRILCSSSPTTARVSLLICPRKPIDAPSTQSAHSLKNAVTPSESCLRTLYPLIAGPSPTNT
jgi:hypothetical protein